jgi:hypothetical protein
MESFRTILGQHQQRRLDQINREQLRNFEFIHGTQGNPVANNKVL